MFLLQKATPKATKKNRLDKQAVCETCHWQDFSKTMHLAMTFISVINFHVIVSLVIANSIQNILEKLTTSSHCKESGTHALYYASLMLHNQTALLNNSSLYFS